MPIISPPIAFHVQVTNVGRVELVFIMLITLQLFVIAARVFWEMTAVCSVMIIVMIVEYVHL
jgi:hypothetical protein